MTTPSAVSGAGANRVRACARRSGNQSARVRSPHRRAWAHRRAVHLRRRRGCACHPGGDFPHCRQGHHRQLPPGLQRHHHLLVRGRVPAPRRRICTLTPAAFVFCPHSGQTGAGKTYTMHGPSIDAEDLHINEQRGLLPRTLEYLFAQIAREQRRVCVVCMRAQTRIACTDAAPAQRGVFPPAARTIACSTSAAAPTWRSPTRSSTTSWTLPATSAVCARPITPFSFAFGVPTLTLGGLFWRVHSHPRGQPPCLPRERHRGPAHVDRGRLRPERGHRPALALRAALALPRRLWQRQCARCCWQRACCRCGAAGAAH